MDGISLILPIYNVENYIEKCLQSIVKSMKSISNIQVILVDDGSKDSSGEIAQKFAEEHPNFYYVQKENGGLSDARNYGLQYAIHNYVSFIDSDDYIDENYFSEIFAAMRNKPDMIIFDWLDVGDNNYFNTVKGMDNPNFLWTVQPSAWNKVYKKHLFDEVKFPKGKIYEDVGTIYKLINDVKTFFYIDKPLYMYRKNRGGSILTTISPKINNIYDVLEDTYIFYERKNALSEENLDGLCYQYIKLLMWSNMYRQLKYFKLKLFSFYTKMRFTRGLLYNRFPHWKSNYFLKNHPFYFIDRYGKNYVKRIDNLGKSFFSTLSTLALLIARNIRKK